MKGQLSRKTDGIKDMLTGLKKKKKNKLGKDFKGLSGMALDTFLV